MIRFLIPVVAMFSLVAFVQTITPQPQVAAVPLITEVVQAEATGPGFFPDPPADDSDCKCGDFAALEKRVAALETKIATYGTARPVASNGSVGGSGQVTVSQPVTTAGLPYGSVVVSERVISSSPQVTTRSRTGLFGTTVTRSVAAPQTCRIVNGVRVCN